MKNHLYRFLFLAFCFALTSGLCAAITEKNVLYKDGDAMLEGYVVYDTAKLGKAPGVIIVHEWNGLGDYVKGRARQLAAMGYQVFCADIYGKGVRPADMEESAAQATIYRSDRALMRSRVNAALAGLRSMKIADNTRIVAIGYCFGGGCVLELARSGADVAGVVSFHGNIDTPMPAKPGEIKARVLVLQGADDKNVTEEQATAFRQEMRASGADWQMVYYGGAVHGFTNPANGNDNTKNVAYNAAADKRSWRAMEDFFGEIFAVRAK